MRRIRINVGDDGPTVIVHETEDPDIWELTWSGEMTQRHARRILRGAETVVLRTGGERVAFTCPPDQAAMQSQLERLPAETIHNEGGRYTMWLMLPGTDGLVHDDTDFRTPLARITCPTCVTRIADTRARRRQEAFHVVNGRQAAPGEIRHLPGQPLPPPEQAGDDAPASRRAILADADGLATQKPHVASRQLRVQARAEMALLNVHLAPEKN